MPDKPSEQEMSIEEILASIRQIIADDDEEPAAESQPESEPAPAQAETKPAPKPEPKSEPKPEPKAEAKPAAKPAADVLELTEVIRDDEPDEEIIIDLQDHEEEIEEEEEVAVVAPPPPPKPAPKPEPAAEDHSDSILTDNAAHAALQGFARLASHTPVERQSHLAGITLEDIVRDLMRPMLRDWLDQNLPPLIEKLVAKELQRLARQAADSEE